MLKEALALERNYIVCVSVDVIITITVWSFVAVGCCNLAEIAARVRMIHKKLDQSYSVILYPLHRPSQYLVQ